MKFLSSNILLTLDLLIQCASPIINIHFKTSQVVLLNYCVAVIGISSFYQSMHPSVICD